MSQVGLSQGSTLKGGPGGLDTLGAEEIEMDSTSLVT